MPGGIYPKLGVYIEMDDFKGMTLEAFVQDIKSFLPKISHFSKKAVVGPKTTLMDIGEIVGKVIPNIEFKHFLPEEKEQAKLWVEEIDSPLGHMSSVDY